MNLMACIIDCTSKHVQDTWVDLHPAQSAQVLIQLLRVLSIEFAHFRESQICEIPGETGPDSRDDL
jgi:hypothetical protein